MMTIVVADQYERGRDLAEEDLGGETLRGRDLAEEDLGGEPLKRPA